MQDIIVFGRGKYFAQKEKNRKDYNIIAFLDNSVPNKIYWDEYECFVYNPKYWSELPSVPILCMSIHFIEMWKQLIDLGVDCERIKFAIGGAPYYYEYEKELFGNGEKIVALKDHLEYIMQETKYSFVSVIEWKKIVQSQICLKRKEISDFRNFHIVPVSRKFGAERGFAVDRVYIEDFLSRYKEDVRGIAMEIESDAYIKKFGGNKVTSQIIIHVKGWENTLKANLETGEGLYENMVDCFICTQTLQYIYHLDKAVENIYKLLRPNGVALITVPGIKSLSQYHDQNWGEWWSFTRRSVNRLFSEVFGEDNVQIDSYGNVKTAMAFLYGLCKEDMTEDDFIYNDEQFPFLITARVLKRL